MRNIPFWLIFSLLLISSSEQLENSTETSTQKLAENATETSTEKSINMVADNKIETSTPPALGRSIEPAANVTDADKERIRVLQEKVREAMNAKKAKMEASVDDNMMANQLVMGLTVPKLGNVEADEELVEESEEEVEETTKASEKKVEEKKVEETTKAPKKKKKKKKQVKLALKPSYGLLGAILG